MPELSIIIPTFNAKAYVAETIKSVFAQTYQSWELIIVDDCSTDDTAQIIQQTIADEPRAQLVILPENSGGPATPRNVGIANATGQFVAFLDSDDIWHPEKLARQLDFMKANQVALCSTDLVYFRETVKDDAGAPGLFHRLIRYATAKRAPAMGLPISNYIYTSSVIVEKDALGAERFSGDAVMVAVEDMHLWMRLLSQHVRYGFLGEKLLYYRLIDSSISERATPKKALLRHMIALLSLAMRASGTKAAALYFGVMVSFARLHRRALLLAMLLLIGVFGVIL